MRNIRAVVAAYEIELRSIIALCLSTELVSVRLSKMLISARLAALTLFSFILSLPYTFAATILYRRYGMPRVIRMFADKRLVSNPATVIQRYAIGSMGIRPSLGLMILSLLAVTHSLVSPFAGP